MSLAVKSVRFSSNYKVVAQMAGGEGRTYYRLRGSDGNGAQGGNYGQETHLG